MNPLRNLKPANVNDAKIFDKFSMENFPQCFSDMPICWTGINLIQKFWIQTILHSLNGSTGGKINASYNCIDRHLAKYKNKTAIHFVPEPEDEAIQHITFQELYIKVNEFAALLKDFCGVKAGDTVTLHMPMIPEIAVAMLACARIGAIHSQVFSGFSGKACGERVADAKSKVLITADSYYRAGNLIDHKEKADIAYDEALKEGQKIEKVFIFETIPWEIFRKDRSG